jgi:hypothetical protein
MVVQLLLPAKYFRDEGLVALGRRHGESPVREDQTERPTARSKAQRTERISLMKMPERVAGSLSAIAFASAPDEQSKMTKPPASSL